MDDLLAHHRTHVRDSLEATRASSWDCFYKALLGLREGLKKAGLYERFEQDYISYCIHFSLWNLNTLKEPARRMLFHKLKREWLRELGVPDYRKRTFADPDEKIQIRIIMNCPYAVELGLFRAVETGKHLVKKISDLST